jgi:hypothetical protein
MVCGQIHAPAYLPNYVHMHVLNRKFSVILQYSKLCLFVFFTKQFPSEADLYILSVERGQDHLHYICDYVTQTQTHCHSIY